MNISNSDRTKLEVFEEVLNNGPITAYSIAINLDMPQSTALRTIKILEKTENIKLYEGITVKGRSKNLFGPTIKGIFSHHNITNSTDKKLEKIWKHWIKNKEFQKISEGYYDEELLKKDPEKVAGLFATQMKFYGEMLRNYEEYIEEYEIPLDMQLNIGANEMIRKDPDGYKKTVESLYNFVPIFRKGTNDLLDSTQEEIEDFRKQQERSVL